MNEWLWLAMLAANFLLILLFYRFYGKTGLYVWIPIATIIANIQVIKVVDLFGFEATLGNIVYASSFLVTDILSENYGKKAANKAVFIGFLSLLSLTGLMSLALRFQPSEADFIQGSLVNIFGFMPRLALASFSAYLIAQLHDVWSYNFWKKRIPGIKHIWLRNNASTMVSQFLDTTIFTFIAFYGVHDWPVLVSIFWTTYVLKWVVAALDTPLVYLARWGYEKGIFEK